MKFLSLTIMSVLAAMSAAQDECCQYVPSPRDGAPLGAVASSNPDGTVVLGAALASSECILGTTEALEASPLGASDGKSGKSGSGKSGKSGRRLSEEKFGVLETADQARRRLQCGSSTHIGASDGKSGKSGSGNSGKSGRRLQDGLDPFCAAEEAIIDCNSCCEAFCAGLDPTAPIGASDGDEPLATSDGSGKSGKSGSGKSGKSGRRLQDGPLCAGDDSEGKSGKSGSGKSGKSGRRLQEGCDDGPIETVSCGSSDCVCSPPPVQAECTPYVNVNACDDGTVTIDWQYCDPMQDDRLSIYACDDFDNHPATFSWACNDGASFCDEDEEFPTSGTVVIDPSNFERYQNSELYTRNFPLTEGECYIAVYERSFGASPPPFVILEYGDKFYFNPTDSCADDA